MTRRCSSRCRQGVVFVGTVMVMLAAEVPAADELARLFTTPQERARLDALRFHVPAPENEEPAGVAGRLVYNGAITGSDGRRVVWINGAPFRDGESPQGIAPRLQENRELRIHPQGYPEAARLKPGQSVELRTGEVRDAYEEFRLTEESGKNGDRMPDEPATVQKEPSG